MRFRERLEMIEKMRKLVDSAKSVDDLKEVLHNILTRLENAENEVEYLDDQINADPLD